MAPAHAASPDWLPTPFHHLTIAHRHQTIPVPTTHSPSFCLVQRSGGLGFWGVMVATLKAQGESAVVSQSYVFSVVAKADPDCTG
jgi:hypothetical protein